MAFKLIITLSVLFVAAHSESVKTISKSINHENKDLIIDDQNLEKTVLTYALCDKVIEPTSKTCKIVRQTFDFNGESQNKSCDVQLKSDLETRVIKSDHRIDSLGSDRVIFMSYDQLKNGVEEEKSVDYYLKFSIVDLTDCSVSEAKTPIVNPADVKNVIVSTLNVRIHEDGGKFEVIFSKFLHCEGMCTVTFDVEGKVVSPIKAWSKDKDFESLMIYEIEEPKGVLAMKVSNNETDKYLKFYMVKDDQSELTMVTYHGYFYGEASTSHGAISTCTIIGNRTMECMHFNFINSKLYYSHLKINTPNDIIGLYVLNCEKDDFLVATVECKIEGSEIDCSGKNFNTNVWKVTDDENKNYSNLELDGLNCDDDTDSLYVASLFENSKDEYCFTRACEKNDILDYKVKCFGLSDFKKM